MTGIELILPALLPAGIDLLKGFFGGIARKVGGISVDDEVKLGNAQTEKLKALAELDNPHGTPSQWVIDLRASFRYISAGVLIIGGLGMALTGATGNVLNADLITLGFETAAAPFAFIFGERLYFGLKGVGNK